MRGGGRGVAVTKGGGGHREWEVCLRRGDPAHGDGGSAGAVHVPVQDHDGSRRH